MPATTSAKTTVKAASAHLSEICQRKVTKLADVKLRDYVVLLEFVGDTARADLYQGKAPEQEELV